MVKTAAEKQKDYRIKLKNLNPEKWESQKQSAKLRMQNLRKVQKSTDSIAEQKRKKRYETLRKRQYRQRLKVCVSPESPSKAYSTPQNLRKALSRVAKVLPKSPRKQKAVIKRLSKDYASPSKSSNLPGQPAPLTPLEQIIQNFYCEDDISRQAPGIKDVITLKIGETKQKFQKRHLLMTVREAYELFTERNADVKIGKSKFASLRPKYVLYMSDIPHNVCLCRLCENVLLLLKALYRYEAFPVRSDKELLQKVVCSFDEACVMRRCEACRSAITNLSGVLEDDLYDDITWEQWEAVEKKVEKITHSGVVQDVLTQLDEMSAKYVFHSWVKRNQSHRFKTCKQAVNGEEIVIQVDFAENYAVQHQNEIQSAHWHHSQVTLFTVVVWLSEGRHKSYVIVSDNLEHEKTATCCFIEEILKTTFKDNPNVKKVHFFSDGCAAQFKNKFMFHTLTYRKEKFNTDIT